MRSMFWASLLAVGLVLSSVPCAHAQNTQTPGAIAQQRADIALRVLNQVIAHYQAGLGTVDDVGAWARRWFDARRQAGLSNVGLTAAAQEWADKLRAFEQVVRSRVSAGAASIVDRDKVLFYRLEAEQELARLKANP